MLTRQYHRLRVDWIARVQIKQKKELPFQNSFSTSTEYKFASLLYVGWSLPRQITGALPGVRLRHRSCE
jgi:hypothetical protein